MISDTSTRLALSTAFHLQPAAVTHVLYHAHCPDGFGAAWAAWKRLGDRAQYIPVSYDNPPPPLPADARVAIVDFAYQRERLLELKSRVAELAVLDHHESAQKQLQGLDFAYFNLSHSGARLSWDYFHPDEAVPDLISYVEDCDLWRWALPRSHEFSIGLSSYAMDLKVWEELSQAVSRVQDEGSIILRYRDRLIDKICEKSRLEKIDGHEVPVVNSPYELASEVCHQLLRMFPQAPFVASYYEDRNRMRQWQLRSGGDFDVSVLAEKFGGGGHRHASGFRIPAPPASPPVPQPSAAS